MYPLQKLEPKNLRQLLVDLGCSVTNEEIFEKYPQYRLLEKEAVKYMGDYTKMRQSLKQLKKKELQYLIKLLLMKINIIFSQENYKILNLRN